MASVYENLGENLVQFDIGIAGLEKRVNMLTRNHKIKDEDAKALVTGFVDAAIRNKESPGEIYGLVNGWARFLYNGTHATVLEQIYRNMAETGTGIDVLKSAGDEQGIQTVAELAWEKHPSLTIEHYKGANRHELLRKIAELYFNSSDKIGLPKRCFTELKDIPNLRRHALAHLENHLDYAKEVLKEHGTDDDVREVIKFLRKRNRLEYFYPHEPDYVLAYDLAMRIKAPTPEDTAMIKELKAALIEAAPDAAINRFWKYSERHYGGGREKSCTDMDGIIASGKRLLAMGKPLDAVQAFESVKYDGPEIIEAGLILIKEIYETGKDQLYSMNDETKQFITRVASKAVPAYLAAGGSILTVESMISKKTCGDDKNREIGLANLSKMRDAPENRGWDAVNAYERFMSIKNKTPEDNANIAVCRERMIKTDHGTSWFEDYEDKEGIQAYFNAVRIEQPDKAYRLAVKIGDTQLIDALRQEVLSKEKPDCALSVFKEAKDEIGIKMIRDKIGPGIDPSVIDTLVERPR